MADVEFLNFGNAGYRANVSNCQSVTSRHVQAILRCQGCAFA